jgi:hypothetical protein
MELIKSSILDFTVNPQTLPAIQRTVQPTEEFLPLQHDSDVLAPVFIEANTLAMAKEELQRTCTIPVFAKDNESTISHCEFIEAVEEIVSGYFPEYNTSIRVSHPIKGRIPEAQHKKASELLPHEETIYYERMMFVIEIPSIKKELGGNSLSLTIGGVRSYHLDNLYAKKTPERFKLFIGFKNKVCCNLCVWSDGYVEDLKALNTATVKETASKLIASFKPNDVIEDFMSWQHRFINEQQFAEFVGRCRMYQYMPKREKAHLPRLAFGDSQINQVVEGYYHDANFCRENDGCISLWNLYNLFTGANKSSYIDKFLDRSVNSFTVIQSLL